jgi:hypothetical protein
MRQAYQQGPRLASILNAAFNSFVSTANPCPRHSLISRLTPGRTGSLPVSISSLKMSTSKQQGG